MSDLIVLSATCKPCKAQLVRIKQAQSDHVVCPACWAGGEYGSVIEQGAGLRTGWEIPQEMKQQVQIAVALNIAREVVGKGAA